MANESLEEPPIYRQGDIVWVKLSNYWWPGEVKMEEDLPKDLVSDFKKPPKVIVKFFDEDSYEYINKWSNIHPYNCERKSHFIKKGMAKYREKLAHMAKFPKDIGIAEEKTNGDPNILSQAEFLPAKKVDLDEIFGTPKATLTTKRAPKDTYLYQPVITHRRFLGNDDYKSQIMCQYPGKDRAPDSDSEDIQKLYDGPQTVLTCEACSFHTKRVGVWLNHGKTHLDGSFAAAKRKSKISEYDFIESDSEATASKPTKPKQRKKPVKKEKKTESVTNWLDEWNVSDEEMEGKESSKDDQGQESLNNLAKEKEDGTASIFEENSAEIAGNQATNNHTVVSGSSLDNTKDDIKNCFDFDDDEEEDDFGFLSPLTEGRKIPRVIPEKPKASITDLLKLTGQEDEISKNLVATEGSETPEGSLGTAPDLNRKEILRVSQSFNRAPAIDDSIENTFKELMEVTEVPELDDLGQTLKPEQNFHDARAVKFPDKGGTAPVKWTPGSSKSISPRKRFVTSFDDFEAGFRKIKDEEIRKQEDVEKQPEQQKPQESASKNKKTEAKSKPETVMASNSETSLRFPLSSDDGEKTGNFIETRRKSHRIAMQPVVKEILDAEMEAINKDLETVQSSASEEIINQHEISLEQLTRDLEGSSDNEQIEDQNKTRRKSNDSNETGRDLETVCLQQDNKVHKETKSKKIHKEESAAVKLQHDSNTTVSMPAQVEKLRNSRSDKVDDVVSMTPDVHKQKLASKSSYKDSSKPSLRRTRSNKSFENVPLEVPQLDLNNEEIVHKSEKTQSELESLVLEPEKHSVCEETIITESPDAMQIEEKIVKATNDIVDDIVDISLKKRPHLRIRKYEPEVPDVKKRSPSKQHTRQETEGIVKRKLEETLMEEVDLIPAQSKSKKQKYEIPIPEAKIDKKVTELVEEPLKDFVELESVAKKSKSPKQAKIEKVTQVSVKKTETKDIAEKATTSLTSRRLSRSYVEKISTKSDKNKSDESATSYGAVEVSEPELLVTKRNVSQKRSDVENEVAVKSSSKTEDINTKIEVPGPIESRKSKKRNTLIESVLLEQSPHSKCGSSPRNTEEMASRAPDIDDKPVVCIDAKPTELLAEASLTEPEILPTNAVIKNLEVLEETQELEYFLKQQHIHKSSELDTSTELIPEGIVYTEKPKDVNQNRGEDKNQGSAASEDQMDSVSKWQEVFNKTDMEKSTEELNFLSKHARSAELAKKYTEMDVSSIPLPNTDISRAQQDIAVPSPKLKIGKKWKNTIDEAESDAALINDGGRLSSHISEENLLEGSAKVATTDMDTPAEATNSMTTEEDSKLPSLKAPGIVIEKHYGGKPKRAGRSRSRWDVVSFPEQPVADPSENTSIELPVSTEVELPGKNTVDVSLIQEYALETSKLKDEVANVPFKENAPDILGTTIVDAQDIVPIETVVTEPSQEVVEQQIVPIIEPELLADIPLPPEPSPIKRAEESPVISPKQTKFKKRSSRRRSVSKKIEFENIEDSIPSIPTKEPQLEVSLESIPLPAQDIQCSVSELGGYEAVEAQKKIVENFMMDNVPDFRTESVVASSSCQSDTKNEQDISLEEATLNVVSTEPTKENESVGQVIEEPVLEISPEKPLDIFEENLDNVALSAETVTQEAFSGNHSETPVVCEVIEALEAPQEIELEKIKTAIEAKTQVMMQATESEVQTIGHLGGLVEAQQKTEIAKFETYVESKEQNIMLTPVPEISESNSQAAGNLEEGSVEAQQNIEDEKVETQKIEKEKNEAAVESKKKVMEQATEFEVLESNAQTVGNLGEGLVEAQQESGVKKFETNVESMKQETMLVTRPEISESNSQTVEDLVEAQQKIGNEEVESYVESLEQKIIQVSELNSQPMDKHQLYRGLEESQKKIENEKIDTSVEPEVEPIEQEIVPNSTDPEVSEVNTQPEDKLQLYGDNVIKAQQRMGEEEIETSEEFIEQELIQAKEAELSEANTQAVANCQHHGDGVKEPQQNIEDMEILASVKTMVEEFMQTQKPKAPELNNETVENVKLEEGLIEEEKIETTVKTTEQEIMQVKKPEASELIDATVKNVKLGVVVREVEQKLEEEKIENLGGPIEQEIKQASEPTVSELKTQTVEDLQTPEVVLESLEAQQHVEKQKFDTPVETKRQEMETTVPTVVESEMQTVEQVIPDLVENVEQEKIVESIQQEIVETTVPKVLESRTQTVGESVSDMTDNVEKEKFETPVESIQQEIKTTVPNDLELQMQTVQQVISDMVDNVEKDKFDTKVESIQQELLEITVPDVLESKMQTVEQVISDTVEQLFQRKDELVFKPEECPSKYKSVEMSRVEESFMLNTEIEGSSSLAALAAASVILENREKGRMRLKKYFQSEDIPLSESPEDAFKITEEKFKSVPPKKKWPRPRRSSHTKKESDIEEMGEKTKSDPFEFTLSEKTEEATTLDSEIILPPKKAKRISEARFLQSTFSEGHISPENKYDGDMSFPIFDDSFMSTSLRNNIEGIINTINTSVSTSTEPAAADTAKSVPPKKKKIEDKIEKVSHKPQVPKKKMQKLFENSQIVEKSTTTELPLMSPLAKKKSFLFQQEDFEQSKIELKNNSEETKKELNVDKFLNESAKRKKGTGTVKKEKIDETDYSPGYKLELGLNLPETATSTKGIKAISENPTIGIAEIDIKQEEIILPELNEAELVPITVAPTVMTETDLADVQVEITTTEVISERRPTIFLESTLKNIITGKKIGEGTSKKIGEGTGKKISEGTGKKISEGTGKKIAEGTRKKINDCTGKKIGDGTGKKIGEGTDKKIHEGSATKFTSKGMLKEFDQPLFRPQIYTPKSDLLDILEGNSNSSTNSSGSEQKFKTSFDNYDTTNVVQGIIDFEEAIPSSQIVATSKGPPDSVIMDSPKLLERLSMASGPKAKVQKVMLQRDIKVPKNLLMPKLVKPMGVPKPGQKIFIKTGKPGGAVISKITGSKPIILSEQILRPATATTPTPIQPQGIKRQYEDIEDVETAFIIPKISKKTEEIEEVAPKPPEKPARSRGSKNTGKAKIVQQAIITTKGDVIPKTTTTTATTSSKPQFQQKSQTVQDESMFDISNMPVVLSEDLTPECIQNMPVVLSENILPPQASVVPVAARAPLHQDKILAALSKKLVVPGGGKQIIFKTTQPLTAVSTSMVGKAVAKSRLLQNPSGTLQAKLTKTGTPALLATGTTPDGKQAKYVLVPPAGTVSALPQMKAVQKTIIKKQPLIQKVVASGVVPAQDQIVGNKIMIVTNSQGQQTRTMLTPQQQIAWMQTQGGIKKTFIKGAIPKALLDSATSVAVTAGPSGIMIPKTVSTVALGATATVTTQAGLLMPVKAAQASKKVTPRTKQHKTVLIKNQMGQTVRKIQGPNNAELDRQVAEQLEAIKAMARQQQAYKSQETTNIPNRQTSSTIPSTSGKQVPRRFTKKVEQKVKVPVSTATQIDTQKPPDITGLVPALAPLSPQTRVSATPKPALTRTAETPSSSKTSEARQQTTVAPVKTEVKQEPTIPDSNPEVPKQVVLRDAAGNLSTVTVGQILALPNDSVDGQPQTYVLVKVDESGVLHPLNNDALMSLDPSLGLGPEINNVILDVDHDHGTVSASKPPEVIGATQKAIKQETPSVNQELQPAKEEQIVPAEPLGQETSINVEQQILIGEGVLPGDAGGQQLMITGDQLATQKFIESLSNGSIDLGSILANAESGSVIVQTDGQQLLIRTHNVPQAMLGVAESTEGGGNPMFATHKPNQDILAAALADTDVFQPTLEPTLKSRGVSPPGGSSSPGGGPGLYPMNAGNVLETSLTLNAPIMTPLEVPTNNNKKIDDEAEILHPVPKNVDLPITITDPNIAQTVANQQAMGLLELSIPMSEVGPITDMNSPSYSYSLPTLDDSVGIQKSFSSSMPLLTEDVVESENSASSDQTRVSKDLGSAPTSFSSGFSSMPMLSETIESTREEVVKTSAYNEFIGTMLDINTDDVIDDSEPSQSRKSKRSRKRSILDQGLAILGGKMCSSLSEPPPDMFDFDALTAPQREEEISSDVSSIPEPETLSLNSENSNEIPLQPPIIASLSDLKGPEDDSASSGSDNKHA